MTQEDLRPFDAWPETGVEKALHLGTPVDGRAGRRALIAAIIAWVPLALLAALDGHAVGGDPHQALLLDFIAYSRYLLAVPLLLLSEGTQLPQLARILHHFVRAGYIVGDDVDRMERLVTTTRKVIRWRWTGLGLIALAFIGTLYFSPPAYAPEHLTWTARGTGTGRSLSPAGWWRLLVSQPMFLALIGMLLVRQVMWIRILWVVSNMRLQLVSSHPDGVGGLRFVTTALPASLISAVAVGAIVAGNVAQALIVEGAAPFDYRYFPPGAVALTLAINAGPIMAFLRPLWRLRLEAPFTYGELASGVGRAFEQRWLPKAATIDSEALGVPDFSATTDLFSVVAVTSETGASLMRLRTLLTLAICTLLPFVPVIFVVLPFDQILGFLGKLVV